ncbi:universal stress protein [Nonomuraea sp. NPDC050556]|uniref:universal stress protein n=1 Tax=Nonomuraea sp. NPDC050556 TaxID=3364369 RepID=UPI0037A7A32E
MSHPRVIVGLDGSRNSLAALRRAAKEASAREAVLDVLYVIDEAVAADPRSSRAARTLAANLADGTAREFPGLKVETVVVAGSAAMELCRHATPTDLLVMGARQEDGPLRGATVTSVLRMAPCRVLLCSDFDDNHRLAWTVAVRL